MRLAAFLLCLPALAQVSSKSAISSRTSISTSRPSSGGGLSLTVEGVSNTQALVSYTAPSASACTVEASESATYLPVVHDVDGALFTGAASDARDGNLGAGTTTRVIRVGTRKAERALDGFMTSRALQTVTPHYLRVTCGASVGTATFTTANIKLGTANYNEPYEGNSEIASLPYTPKAGLYAWPDFHSWDKTDPTARPEAVIDPNTGVLLKRIALPGDQSKGGNMDGDREFTDGIGSAWTNPNNIVVDDTSSATYSGSGKAFIFARGSSIAAWPGGTNLYDFPYDQLETVTLGLKAWCSSGGTCATGDNAKVEACVTINGVTCWPDNAHAAFREGTLGTSALPSSYVTLGTATAIMAPWTPAGYQPLNRMDVAYRSGNADVDVSGNVTWTGGGAGYFNLSWIAGSKIVVNGQECAISSVTSAHLLTIDTGSCSLSLPLTGTAWSAGNFGFLIRHKTTSTDQINIQYAKYSLTSSQGMGWSASGSVRYCTTVLSQNTVTGRLGYHCKFESTDSFPLFYWIDQETADANYLGLLSTAGGGGGADGWSGNTFESGTPVATAVGVDEYFYFAVTDNSSKRVLLKCTITTTNQPGSVSTSCVNLTLGSLGHDLNTLAAAFTAGDPVPFDGSLFPEMHVVGPPQADGKVLLAVKRGDQNSLGWTLMFDPALVDSAAGCIGGVTPGCIVGAFNSFSTFPCRWCVIHTSFNSGDTSYVYVAGQPMEGGQKGRGPYEVTMTGHLPAVPTINAGSGSCPAGTLGCDAIVIDGEPCNPDPRGDDPLNCPKNASWNYLQPAIVGDILKIENEYIRLAVKTNATHWLIQRGYPNNNPQDHSGSQTLQERCTSTDFTFGSSVWDSVWNSTADPHGQNAGGSGIVIASPSDHVSPGPYATVGGYGAPLGRTPCTAPECYGVKVGVPVGGTPDVYVAEQLNFNGVGGIGSNIFTEDHAGRLQSDSIAAEADTFLDARRLSTTFELMDGATLLSGNLYKYTSTTSDGDNLSQVGINGPDALAKINRKLMPQFAFSGIQPLRDISSPATGNIITDDSTSAFTYCIARKVDECRTSSVRGNIYINSPAVARNPVTGNWGCDGFFRNGDDGGGLCVTNNSGFTSDVIQVGFTVDDYVGKYARALTGGLARYLIFDNYWNAKAFYDSSWVIFRSFALGGVWHDALAMKLPPLPTSDGVDRSNYVPYNVVLAAPGGSVDNVLIAFGYAEYGAPTNLYCTSRADTCYAAASPTTNNPLKFAEDGSGAILAGLTGVSCASGCTVPIPTVSQRTLYFQVIYRNASNAILSTGAMQMALVP